MASPRAEGQLRRQSSRGGTQPRVRGIGPFRLATVFALTLLVGIGTVTGGTFLGHSGDPNARVPGLRAMAASISLTPTSGKVGTNVTVSGSGFGSGAQITIRFGGSIVSTTPSPCVASTGGSVKGGGGAFTCHFLAPTGNSGPNTVSATDGTNTAKATFTETGLMSLSLQSVDVGQNDTLTGNGFSAAVPISSLTLGATHLNCTFANDGICSNGTVTTDGSGGFNVTFLAPSVPLTGIYLVNATDSLGHNERTNLSVALDPKVSALTTSAGSADVGETIVLNATVSAGSGGFTYSWQGLPGCTGASDPLRCVVSTPGPATVNLTATDSNQFSVTSPNLALTVDPDPTVTAPAAFRVVGGPATQSVDLGQPVTFMTAAKSGSGSYLSFNWSGLPAGCAGNTSSVSCVPSAPGEGPVTVTVLDSNKWRSVSNGSLDFTVYADPFVPVPVANRSSADVGQSVGFEVPAAGGSGGFLFNWTGLPQGCPGPSGALTSASTQNCTVGTAGRYDVMASVTDSDGYTSAGSPLTFEVFADPTATLSSPHPSIDPGQPFEVNAVVGLGSGGLSYAWTGLPVGCESASASVSCSTKVPGVYPVTLKVTDSNRFTIVSSPLDVNVSGPITVSVATSPTSTSVGVAVTFQVTATGGTGTLSFAWAFDDGTRATGNPVSHTFTSAGMFVVDVWANDSAGGSVAKSTTITVTASSSTPAPQSTSPTVLPEVAAAVVVIAAAALVAGLWMRRRKPAPPAEAGDEPGPEPPPEL
jgi:hypothetical protein